MKIIIISLLVFSISLFADIVVQKGDTLSKISANTGFTVAEIVAVNPGLKPNQIKVGQKIKLPALDFNRLFSAFVYVESRGNDHAVGDNGKAVGCIQMWPIMVDEVNRLHHTHYTYADRLDRNKCKGMFIRLMKAKKVQTVADAVKVWNPKSSGKAYKEAYRNKK